LSVQFAGEIRMEFFNRQGNDPVANPVTLVQCELRRLSERECDLKQRLAAAQLAIVEANSARQKLLLNGPAMFKRRAIRAADDRVSKAETESHVLADTLAAITLEREAAQQKLDGVQDQERRLDEASTVALVTCEIVDAIKAFERATERLASALDGLPGRAAHTAPMVAASLRLRKSGFAAEAGALISEIEGYRAGLLDGSVKLKEPAPLESNSIGREPVRARQFVTGAPPMVPSLERGVA
jgi:hypothetical protein